MKTTGGNLDGAICIALMMWEKKQRVASSPGPFWGLQHWKAGNEPDYEADQSALFKQDCNLNSLADNQPD